MNNVVVINDTLIIPFFLYCTHTMYVVRKPAKYQTLTTNYIVEKFKSPSFHSSLSLSLSLSLSQSQQSDSYTWQVSGPGLTSATVNHPTHILVELTNYSDTQLPLQLNVTAQLELFPKPHPPINKRPHPPINPPQPVYQ